MIKKLFEKVIPIVAKEAVGFAEKAYGKGKGEEKKALVVRLILDVLPFPAFVENLMYAFLKELIDDSIEYAVGKLDSKGIAAT